MESGIKPSLPLPPVPSDHNSASSANAFIDVKTVLNTLKTRNTTGESTAKENKHPNDESVAIPIRKNTILAATSSSLASTVATHGSSSARRSVINTTIQRPAASLPATKSSTVEILGNCKSSVNEVAVSAPRNHDNVAVSSSDKNGLVGTSVMSKLMSVSSSASTAAATAREQTMILETASNSIFNSASSSVSSSTTSILSRECLEKRKQEELMIEEETQRKEREQYLKLKEKILAKRALPVTKDDEPKKIRVA